MQKLILEKHSQYASLDGWLGPRKYEDLPIHAFHRTFPETHPDQRISKGLEAIRKLDEILQDKTLEAMIVQQECFPDKWQKKEKRRLRKKKRELDQALKSALKSHPLFD